MKKYSYVGALVDLCEWVLHPVANYKELHDYRNTFDMIQLDYQKHEEEFDKKLKEEQKKVDDLKELALQRKNALVENEKKMNEYKAIIVDLENKGIEKSEVISEIKSDIRSLEQKVIYRNNVITGLRNANKEFKDEIKELEEQLDKARKEVLVLAKKVEFYEKQAKKTPKEKVDYLMKRSKKNENSKRNV